MTQSIQIVEVSPRDGIQNEKEIWPTETKVELIKRAVNAGAPRIEVTSFVNPKLVPQLADADAVAAQLPRDNQASYIGLVLNKRGYERVVGTGLHEANIVVSASDTFGIRNQGTDTNGTIRNYTEIMSHASAHLKNGVTITTAFGCPFDGEVPLTRLLDVVSQCMQAEPFEIGIADTIGVATPRDVTERIDAIKQLFPDIPLRVHFHDTRNTGIANAWAAVQAGVNTVDASFGGVGGCPFAPRATGNISTEDLLYMLHRSNIETGMSLEKAIDTAEWVEQQLGKTVPGMVMKAGGFPSTTKY
jgi:hydroxymethylglutaryl-CoA lyase